MKMKFMTVAMLAAATWFAPKANAQGGARSIPVSFKTAEDPKTAAAPDGYELAKKTQTSTFQGATDITWEQQTDHKSVCSFSLNNVRYRAAYNKKGMLRWTEKSYNGAALDQEIRNMIFHYYGEVTIHWVHEVEVPQSSTNYFATISSKTNSWRIRIVDNDIATMEEYDK